jgi:hypothetical protein
MIFCTMWRAPLKETAEPDPAMPPIMYMRVPSIGPTIGNSSGV